MLKNKRVLIGVIAAIAVIAIITVIIILTSGKKTDIDIDKYPDIAGNQYVTEKADGTKENNSSKLKEDKGFDTYKISNASLVFSAGKTTFKATIRNVSKGEIKGQLVDIILLDKKGQAISKISTYIRDLKIDETMELSASISKDVVNAYDYKLEKK